MVRLIVALSIFAFCNCAWAKMDKRQAALFRGDSLSGSYDCELTNTLSSAVVKAKLVLEGRDHRYDAQFYDGKTVVIIAEGLHDPEFPSKFKMNYVNKVEGHTGVMNLNFSDDQKKVGGNWYSFASFKLGSLNCNKRK